MSKRILGQLSGLFLAGACAVAVTGCASEPKTVIKVDPGIVKLSEAADQIAESYRVLSYAESAQNTRNGAAAPSQRYDPDDFPKRWRKKYTLAEAYYGELEPFVRGLSRLVGYDEPQIIGERPVNPVVVSINKSKRALADFLVDASYQASDRANITLSEDKHRLRIAY